MKKIRIATKAIIRRDGQILLIKFKNSERGIHYGFPGGGQEHGETLEASIIRECLEEIGQDVQPLALVHVREFIGRNQAPSTMYNEFHQVECYFECKLLSNRPYETATVPDANQIGVEWIDIEKLPTLNLVPQTVGQVIASGKLMPVYLGDVN